VNETMLKGSTETIAFSQFEAVDLRVGQIVEAALSPKAHIPAFKLRVDFGPLGILTSSARLTHFYTSETLVNQLIIAVVNFPPRQVATTRSECLVLGALNTAGEVILLRTDPGAKPGDPVR
jgi:tRNA-binding protein